MRLMRATNLQRRDYDQEEALRGSEAQFRSFFESMDQGYLLVDVIVDEHDAAIDLLYVEANAAAVRMTGTELVGRRTRELSPDYEAHWFETFGRVARTGVGERHELSAGPLDAWYDVYVFKVGAPDTRRVAAVYQDVTIRKRAEATLRTNAVRQAYLLALTDTIRPLLDPVAIQNAATRLLGDQLEVGRAFYGESHADGTFVISGDYGRNAPSVAGVYRFDDFPPVGEILRTGRTFVLDDIPSSPDISAEVGARFASFGVGAQIAVPLLRGGRFVAALMVHQASPRTWTPLEVSLVQDTAERTWAEVARARSEAALRDSEEKLRLAHADLDARVRQRTAELARSNAALEKELGERRAAEAQIQALVKQLLTIQEEERRRIARDIHDQLGQQMTALRLQLEALLSRTGEAQPALAGGVGKAQQLAQELDQSIDFLTWELTPTILDQLGLVNALGHLVNTWSLRFQITAEYQAPEPAAVQWPPEIETNLYRLAQEALHNIYKHAGAKRVTVVLEQRDGHARLVIEDDGRGFEPAEVRRDAAAGGLGLVTMRERAALTGGELQIESATGRGTAVHVRVPLPETGA